MKVENAGLPSLEKVEQKTQTWNSLANKSWKLGGQEIGVLQSASMRLAITCKHASLIMQPCE